MSTTEQADKGVSLEAQRRRLDAYCEAHGLALVAVEEDAGVSAKRTLNRSALQRALKALGKGEASGLVAVKLDRLSRTTRDVLDLVSRAEKEWWALHSIDERLDTSSPQGRFVVTVLGALAQPRVALAELRQQGRRVSGRPPFGFRFKGGRVVEVAEEQRVLARMKGLAEEGAGCYRIATVLNGAGDVNPRTRAPWFFGTVRAILDSAARRGA